MADSTGVGRSATLGVVPWSGPTRTELLGSLVVRPIQAAERLGWRLHMERYHYLGCGQLVGESLRYAALVGDELVALLGWAAAALYNGPRDHYVGWDSRTRACQLPWVVNNVRFLILPWIKVRHLASRILGANLRRLSRDWEAVFGHAVLMAETFVDVARFRGTCYRASNWIHLGETRGFSRSGRSYHANGSPKAVFVYPLVPDACERLRSPEGLRPNPRKEIAKMKLDFSRLPLDGKGGLIEVLRGIPDSRNARGKRYAMVSIMAIATCATLAGAKSIRAIAHWAKDQSTRTLTRMLCRKGKAPSEATLWRVLGQIDVTLLDQRVGEWLVKRQISFVGQGLAIDGKTLCGSKDGETKAVHLVSAVLHDDAVVVAQHRVPEKTNEIKSVEPLFENLNIAGAVVTGDAMFTQKEIATHVVEKKSAHYLFAVKDNQPTLRQDIEDLHLEAFPPSAQDD